MATKSLRVVFMGTARFAVPSLEVLQRAGYEVVRVVSQPPRPAGRGRAVAHPPVAQAAERLGLPVLAPEKLRAPESVKQIAELRPDLIVVAAYAQILPRSVLALPRFGCINVHASLLPQWRGASPVQAAILAGDEFTGVSIMLMEPSMDTGPVLGQIMTRIEDTDAAPDLESRLSQSGAALLSSVLPQYLEGAVTPVPQDAGQATYAPLIDKKDGLIDWSLPARRIWLASRAYRPWPGTYSIWEGRLLKILSCAPHEVASGTSEIGTVLALRDGRSVGVVTGEGVLRLDEVALEGSRAMGIREFLAGHRAFVGSRLSGRERKEGMEGREGM